MGGNPEFSQTKITEEEMKRLVTEETWMTGKDAINYFDIEPVEEKQVAAYINKEIMSKYVKTPEELKNLEDTADVEPIEKPSMNNKIIKELEEFLKLQ